MDGQKQRQALTAAERALQGLASGAGGPGPVEAARKAGALDQVGLFAGLEEAVSQASEEISAQGAITVATRQRLLDLVGPGPLQPLVERIPSGE